MLATVGVNCGPVVLNFLTGTISLEVADSFSGSSNSQRYGQHYQYVPTSDIPAIRCAKRKGTRLVETNTQELNAENVLLKRQRRELSTRMLYS